MEKFRELFLTLTKEDGTYIGVDPYNHLTIPSVAFEGIYMRDFLPPQTLITVPRPTEENHSFKQILWLEYVMSQNEGFVAHARNGGEVKVTVNNGKKFKNWMGIVTPRILPTNFLDVIITDVPIATRVKEHLIDFKNMLIQKEKK